MADTKISALTAAAAAALANEIPINEAGTTKKITLTQVQALLGVFVDGSASNYIKIGNFMIQWGIDASESVAAGATADTTVTYPIAFKSGSTPIVVTAVSGLANTNNIRTMALSVGNTTFSFRKFNNDSSVTESAFVGSWIAVGLIA